MSDQAKFFKIQINEESKTIFSQSQKENLMVPSPTLDPPAAYKKKKTLKLLTNNTVAEDPDKFKLFTPQPPQNPDLSMFFLNCINVLSHPPSRKLKAQNSKEFHDFFYRDDVHEVVMKRCGRKTQEDRFCVNLLKEKDPFFGVFDGHGGNSLCSELMSEVFHKYIENQPEYENDPILALKTACLQFDEELLDLLQKNNLKGGSTALMCLIKAGKLYVINVGDSLSAMVNQQEAIQLNVAHTPQNLNERKNLDLKGAIIIEKNKTFRVLGELAVSRAFGDKNYKDFISAEPDIDCYDMGKMNADYLLIASDGFWNMIKMEELPSLYSEWLNSKEKKDYLSEFLINEAENRFTEYKKDNMTMILVNLQNIETMKQVSQSFGCVNQSKKNIPNQVCFEFNSDVE